MSKTLTNTLTPESDVFVFGNPNDLKLLFKASSAKEGWMKSTKAYEIEGVGCIIHISEQQGDNITTTAFLARGVKIEDRFDETGKVVGRRLVKSTY